jgi:hypothetical protein
MRWAPERLKAKQTRRHDAEFSARAIWLFVRIKVAHSHLVLSRSKTRTERPSTRRLQIFSHAVERCRPRHSHPEGSQGGVRQAAIAAILFLATQGLPRKESAGLVERIARYIQGKECAVTLGLAATPFFTAPLQLHLAIRFWAERLMGDVF